MTKIKKNNVTLYFTKLIRFALQKISTAVTVKGSVKDVGKVIFIFYFKDQGAWRIYVVLLNCVENKVTSFKKYNFFIFIFLIHFCLFPLSSLTVIALYINREKPGSLSHDCFAGSQSQLNETDIQSFWILQLEPFYLYHFAQNSNNCSYILIMFELNDKTQISFFFGGQFTMLLQ